jgi:hypothetical protein
MAASMTW